MSQSPRGATGAAGVRARSQAVYFNVRVAEILKATADPVARACVVPILLEEVIESLGPYKDVMTLLKDELVTFCFSEDEFTSGGSTAIEGVAAIQRMPYFALLERVTRMRRVADGVLRTENDELRKKVVQLGVSTSAMSETIRGQQTELGNITEELENVRSDLADVTARLRRAEDDRDYAKASATRQIQELERQLAVKEGIIRQQKVELENVSEYREQYATIQRAFSSISHRGSHEVSQKRRIQAQTVSTSSDNGIVIGEGEGGGIADSQSLSLSAPTKEYVPEEIDRRDMEELEKIEDQLHSLKNLLLSDFEVAYDTANGFHDTTNLRDSLVADVAATDLELQSISRHRAIIASRLQRGYHHGYDPMPVENSEGERKRLQKLLQPRRKGANANHMEDSEGEGEEEEEEEEEEPQMVWPPPLPVVKSRHAVFLALSYDGAKSFKTHRAVSVCNACGDRTTMCPHRGSDEIIVGVQPSPPVTHVKVYRPKLVVPPHPRIAEVNLSKLEDSLPLANKIKSKPSVRDLSGDRDIHVYSERSERGAFYMGLLWADFFHRGGVIPSHSRPLTVTQVSRMVSEAYTVMDRTHLVTEPDEVRLKPSLALKKSDSSKNGNENGNGHKGEGQGEGGDNDSQTDGDTSTDESSVSVSVKTESDTETLLDVLHRFMYEKYGNQELAMSVTHDMFLVVHKVKNAHVELGFFHRVMATELNVCVWRYTRFLENYCEESQIKLNTKLDLEVFARVIYPVQFQGDGKEEHAAFIERILLYLWRWEAEAGSSAEGTQSHKLTRSQSRRSEWMTTTSFHDASGSVMSVLSPEGEEFDDDDDDEGDGEGEEREREREKEKERMSKEKEKENEKSEEDEHDAAEREAISLARLSVSSFMRYIRRACVLKTELRYRRMYIELKKRDVFYRGFLSFEEFWEALHTQLLPTIPKETVEYFYKTIRRSSESDSATIENLAWVGAYLELTQVVIPPSRAKNMKKRVVIRG